jgi:hypothetical protein
MQAGSLREPSEAPGAAIAAALGEAIEQRRRGRVKRLLPGGVGRLWTCGANGCGAGVVAACKPGSWGHRPSSLNAREDTGFQAPDNPS